MMIHAKVGTLPMGVYKALKKKTKPKVGDELSLRGERTWIDFRVRVTEIRDIGFRLYVVERI